MSAANSVDELTPRDREVLRLVAQGLTDDEMAARLEILHQSLYNRISRLYRKLGIPRRSGNRSHLVVWAAENGFPIGKGGARQTKTSN